MLDFKDAKNLQQSLGKKSAKVVFHTSVDGSPVKRNNITNSVLYEMQSKYPTDCFCPVNDVLVGVVNLDWGGSKTLSVTSLYLLLQTIENINSKTVAGMFEMSERNARRYVQAVRIALPYLEKILLSDEEDLDILEQIGDNQLNDLEDY